MLGDKWMDIRSDRQKSMNWTEIGIKHGVDPPTAKKYAISEETDGEGRQTV